MTDDQIKIRSLQAQFARAFREIGILKQEVVDYQRQMMDMVKAQEDTNKENTK